MSNKMALDALKFAEAALADIGDADREPGDDLAWCEARAAEALPQTRAAIAALQAEPQPDAAFVRNLLWDEHPECCGCPVVGAIYMGEQEMVCCGQPEPALLNDRQIVASLRVKFPALPTPPKD